MSSIHDSRYAGQQSLESEYTNKLLQALEVAKGKIPVFKGLFRNLQNELPDLGTATPKFKELHKLVSQFAKGSRWLPKKYNEIKAVSLGILNPETAVPMPTKGGQKRKRDEDVEAELEPLPKKPRGESRPELTARMDLVPQEGATFMQHDARALAEVIGSFSLNCMKWPVSKGISLTQHVWNQPRDSAGKVLKYGVGGSLALAGTLVNPFAAPLIAAPYFGGSLFAIGLGDYTIRAGHRIEQLNVSQADDWVKKNTVDLVELSKQGEEPKDFGRVEETNKLMETLRSKGAGIKSAILAGPPGVGKTSVVEGLAQRIKNGTAGPLNGVRILSLSVDQLMAGASKQGDLDERVRYIIAYAKKHPEVRFFIDEAHALMRAGTAEGAIPVTDELKQALANGELSLIMATTDEEYEQIAHDPALKTRLIPIYFDEPTIACALDMVRSQVPKIEEEFNVVILEKAISTAVEVPEQVLSGCRPRKPLTLIRAAASRISMTHKYEPIEIQKLHEAIKGNKMTLDRLFREFGTEEKQAAITKKLEQDTTTLEQKTKQWESEKKILEEVQLKRAEFFRLPQGARKTGLYHEIQDTVKHLKMITDVVDEKVIQEQIGSAKKDQILERKKMKMKQTGPQ